MEHIVDATSLSRWENFYVIIGSSAAALTGLQFVVVALGAESASIMPQTIRAFATPTIVHFCAVLLISAILSAPWQLLSQPSIALAVCGILGTGYTMLVIRHTRAQSDYVPVFEDWLWHWILPLIAYLSLSLASIALPKEPLRPLFFIGGSAILLLFIGIHNAWDAAAYIAVDRAQRARDLRNRLAAAPADQARADAPGVNAHEKPRDKNHADHNKRQGNRQRRG